MAELVRTNDPGVISAIEGLLGGADIPYQVTDRNMSVLEGSIIAIQMRILVPDDHEAEARELLVDAELGNWLRPLDPGAVARLRGMQGASGQTPILWQSSSSRVRHGQQPLGGWGILSTWVIGGLRQASRASASTTRSRGRGAVGTGECS